MAQQILEQVSLELKALHIITNMSYPPKFGH